MDEKTKAKYLAVLSKTVLKATEEVFAQRVNGEKHEYADWVAKNMQDNTLADEIRQKTQKQDLLMFLLSKMKELRSVPAQPQPTDLAAEQPPTTPETTPKTTPQQPTTAPETPMTTPAPETAPQTPATAPEAPTTAPQQPTAAPKMPETTPKAPETTTEAPSTFTQPATQQPADTEQVAPPKPETAPPSQPPAAPAQPPTTPTAPETAPPQQTIPPAEPTPTPEPTQTPQPEPVTTPKLFQTTQPETTPQPTPTPEPAQTPPPQTPQTPVAPPEQPTQPEQQIQPENPEDKPFYLRELEQEKQFMLPGGESIKSIEQLATILPTISPDAFSQHVNPSKNDFAAWIYHAIHDEELAQSIGPIKDRAEMVKIITDRISKIKSETTVMTSQPIEEPMQTPPITTAATTPPTPSTTPPTTEVPTTPKAPEQAGQIQQTRQAGQAVQFEPARQPEGEVHFDNEELRKKAEAIKARILKQRQERGLDKPETEEKEKDQEKDQEKDLFKKEYEKEPESKEKKGLDESTKTEKTPDAELENIKKSATLTQEELLNEPIKDILIKLGLITSATQYLALQEEITTIKKERKKIFTGVPGFDEMVDDGIPAGSSILLSGGPGSGKTTFAIQMLGRAAEQGEKCLFMTFEENEEQLIEHMESYGLNPRKHLEKGNLIIQRQDPFKVSRMVEALLAHARGELLIDIDKIIDIIPRGFKPDRVVIDSLSAIAAAFSESSTAYRVYVTQLIKLLERTGATSFLIGEVQGIEKAGHGFVEEFLADGVIVFYNLQKGNIKQSAMEILKMRAVNHEKKIVPFEFVTGQGIIVYPLERTFI